MYYMTRASESGDRGVAEVGVVVGVVFCIILWYFFSQLLEQPAKTQLYLHFISFGPYTHNLLLAST
ncbi:hypothetical protein GBAR_LOCUS22927, partial [Geodia barretti]